MSEEKFIMVSLEEEKSKSLAKILASKTSRKILDYLSTKEEASESDVSKELKIPLSTAHYNLKHLKKAGLVEVKEFKWSQKGREIDLYRIAKKHIIISPKGTSLTKDVLKKILPVTLFSGAIAIAINLFNKSKASLNLIQNPALERVEEESARALPLIKDTFDASMGAATNQTIVQETCNVIPQVEPNYALWFFLGALVAMGLYFLITLIRKK